MIFFIKSFLKKLYIFSFFSYLFMYYIFYYKFIYRPQVLDNQGIKLLKENSNLIRNLTF